MLNQWLVTLFFSLSLCASSSWALAADASDEAGWLSEIRGTPTINVAQPQGGRIARVEAGDSIVTRDGDFVELGLGPKAFLRIGGNSRLNVNSTKPVEMKFEITGGTVIVDAFKLEEKKQSVKIATQAGEISLNRPALVRLDVSTDGAVQVLVQEGVVE